MALQQSSNAGLRELALFAGAGGGILGGKLLGWRTICAVEWEPYPAGVLIQRQNEGILPPFPIWDDVRTFDGTAWRGRVDVVSGGFPCQDISSAGTGKGLEGARSGMWHQMARIIGEVRPRHVLIENSPMLTLRGGYESLETLPPWGMIVGGELYQQQTPSGLEAHRASIISESVSGLSERAPTPTCGGGGQTIPDGTTPTGKRPDGTKATVSLEQFVNNFAKPPRVPTPKESDAGRGSTGPAQLARKSPDLGCVVRRVPTPTVCGNYNRKGASATSGDGLATVVSRVATPCSRDSKDSGANTNYEALAEKGKLAGQLGGPLNPTWCEWLMGFPRDWTDLKQSATDRFRQWWNLHGKY